MVLDIEDKWLLALFDHGSLWESNAIHEPILSADVYSSHILRTL